MPTDSVDKVPRETPLYLLHVLVMQVAGKPSTLEELVDKASSDKLESIKERAQN